MNTLKIVYRGLHIYLTLRMRLTCLDAKLFLAASPRNQNLKDDHLVPGLKTHCGRWQTLYIIIIIGIL